MEEITNKTTEEIKAVEIDSLNKVITENLPLPFSTEVEIYNTPFLKNDDIPTLDRNINQSNSDYYENDRIVIVTDKYLFNNRDFKFEGKPVFVKKMHEQQYRYGILKPDFSHIQDEEEMTSIRAFHKDNNGSRIPSLYEDKDGKEIRDINNKTIPIIKSDTVKYAMRISNQERNLEKMREYFKPYLDDPEKISYDGHSIGKHSFDAAISLKILTDPQYKSGSYFSVSEREITETESENKRKTYSYVITTKETETIFAKALPEKLLHTQIAFELAGDLREKIDGSNKKEMNRIGKNFKEWLKEFSNDEPLLGIILYNEVKYLLKYGYNEQYGSSRKFTIEDIEELLPNKEMENAVIDYKKYYNEALKISEIFKGESVNNPPNYMEKLFSFESKVDETIAYLEYRNIDSTSLDYIKLSGYFDEMVRPVLVLNSYKLNQDGKTGLLPTTSITTSYLERYPRHNFLKQFRKIILGKGVSDEIASNAQKTRDLLDDAYLNIGGDSDKVESIHILTGNWINSISLTLGKMLDISKEKVEEYAKKAILITNSHKEQTIRKR